MSSSSTGGQRRRTKILSHAELLERRRGAQAMGLSVVQCHGCFDIVHPGHVRHLRQAKSHADILLVSITGDSAFTKRRAANRGGAAGSGGAFIPEDLRAENLAELDCVDWVYIDQRSTAAELLDEVRPDIYIKGREYEHNRDPRFAQERACVERHGGRVVFSSGDVVFSSTALIAALERTADPFHTRLAQLLSEPELSGPALTSAIGAFRGQRVLVVGEVIRDVYVLCDRPEVASESPVLTLRPLERRTYDGGAAVIARHLAALGARPTLLTGLPDLACEELRRRLTPEGIEVHSVPTDTPMPEKHRFLVGSQKVMKLNQLEPFVLDAHRQDALIDAASRLARPRAGAAPFAAAIVADFGNGLLTPAVLSRLLSVLRPQVPFLSGDVSGRRGSLLSLHGLDLLCPSEVEAREALHLYDESIPGVAWELLSRTSGAQVLLTLGGDGLIAFDRLPEPPAEAAADPYRSRLRGQHIPALSGHPVDPLGCGDALLATATLARATGASLLAAGFLGSLAAACEAQRLGNIPIGAADLRAALARLHTARLAYAPAEANESIHAAALSAQPLGVAS